MLCKISRAIYPNFNIGRSVRQLSMSLNVSESSNVALNNKYYSPMQPLTLAAWYLHVLSSIWYGQDTRIRGSNPIFGIYKNGSDPIILFRQKPCFGPITHPQNHTRRLKIRFRNLKNERRVALQRMMFCLIRQVQYSEISQSPR